ncbi:MAG TPA: ACP S-malonyltransferase [Candidatus Dormibacteraeota bacterium]|nr:ACP S-malonyltransferase [Candidatus Dormibacteraeota bacterium]
MPPASSAAPRLPQLRALQRARGRRHRVNALSFALCFPGQGSQTAGMADGLLETQIAQDMLRVASDAGVDLEQALHGDADALRPTEIAQPALLLVECALHASLPATLEVVAVAGHSVGEYAACVAAQALAPADAMTAVLARGRAMAAMREGTMSAVIGLDADAVEDVCAQVRSTGEVVVVANLNAPGQVVISGSRAGVDAARALAAERGARRAIELNVSGAFHSPLMGEAAQSFEPVLDALPLRDPVVPVVCNVDAAPARAAATLRDRLRRQLTSAVRWVDTVHELTALGATTLVEVGPGNVLTGLARRISPDVAARAVNSVEAAQA